ncbi:hypothetical protein BpHYR1_005083 [Brachionus plicatilis]|uniref:Uncharacterized protein n=1 Tax=Brachionus plicatilis TaxID=10195 RepID=A0A3M7SUN2_BRAPC|nr:hypothetical protein BpHYR1_005083 [Brachionus plicatilis]
MHTRYKNSEKIPFFAKISIHWFSRGELKLSTIKLSTILKKYNLPTLLLVLGVNSFWPDCDFIFHCLTTCFDCNTTFFDRANPVILPLPIIKLICLNQGKKKKLEYYTVDKSFVDNLYSAVFNRFAEIQIVLLFCYTRTLFKIKEL